MLHELAEGWWVRYKIRLVLTVIVIWIVSLVMSCQELRYSAFGKSTDAHLFKDQVENIRDSNGIMHKQRAIWYTFMDGDLSRREYAKVSLDYPHPEGPTVKIQYIAGKQDQSRLAGQHHYGWMTLFFTSLAAMAAAFYLLSREK